MEELNNETVVSSENVENPTGYRKKIELTDEQKKKEGVSVSSIVGKVLMYVFLFIFVVWTLFPLFVGFIASLISKTDFKAGIANLFPRRRTKYDLIDNYREIFFGASSKT
ncbi:MAG TPA: hypothetical protein DDY82_03065, partial [Clostridiales bacterium]|nr:hypothetical protein [Clostridiales bacterium]